MTDVVAALITQIAAGSGIDPGLYAPTAVLDATVPGWRFQQHGPAAVAAQLSDWYADPGTFTELDRTPLPTGEAVTFTLRWQERGIEHATHQAHLLEVEEGRITHQQAWCGGRWPAPLLAEMGLLSHA